MKSMAVLVLTLSLAGSSLPVAAQNTPPGDPDAGWKRVCALRQGAALTITVRGKSPQQKYLWRADDSGISVTGRRVDRIDQTVEFIPRSDIQQLAVPEKTVGSSSRAIAGVLAGLAAGFAVIALASAATSDDLLAAGTLITVAAPVALGLWGSNSGRHTVGGVIYQAG